jgi:hypothetical protein
MNHDIVNQAYPMTDDEIKSHIDDYRLEGFTWHHIAESLHRNDKWLYRWKINNDYVDPRREVTDEELDELVHSYVVDHPERGNVMVLSCLAADNILVTRNRVRQSIHRVDPINVAIRKRKRIHRVHYQVAGPHHLWHCDGNHKLKDFHLVIHGAIDGFSRSIIYLLLQR